MDPGIVAGPDKACVLLFHSEDCSEIGGKNVDSSTIDAMEVDILGRLPLSCLSFILALGFWTTNKTSELICDCKGDYGLCWIFTDDGTKYSSYIANTVSLAIAKTEQRANTTSFESMLICCLGEL